MKLRGVMDYVHEKVLKAIRSDFSSLAGHEDSFYEILINKKMLLTALTFCSPSQVQSLPGWVLEKQKEKLAHLAMQERAIEQLVETSKSLNLRFVVLKGQSLSNLAYGKPFARESNDLDILVAHDDLGKMDCLLRELGFEACTRRKQYKSNSCCYITRRSVDSAHLLPYYALYREGMMKIELHDSLEGFGGSPVDQFFWETATCTAGDTPYNVLDAPHSIASLIVSAYENSESIYANQPNGWIILRDYVDLHFVLMRKEKEFREARNILKGYSLEYKMCVVLKNLSALYPNDERLARIISASTKGFSCESSWSADFCERALDEKVRIDAGIRDIVEQNNRSRVLLDPYIASRAGSNGKQHVYSFGERAPRGLHYSLCYADDTLIVRWDIPATLSLDIDCYAYRTILYNNHIAGNPDPFVVRSRLKKEDGKWVNEIETGRSMGNGAPCGEAAKHYYVAERENGQNMCLDVPIPLSLFEIGNCVGSTLSIAFAFEKKRHGTLYYEIASSSRFDRFDSRPLVFE